jgi:O-antigen/teichoic acid export membrane protein
MSQPESQPPSRPPPRWRRGLMRHLGTRQHANAYVLLLNNVLVAAAGLLFWLLLTRILAMPASDVGFGYAIVAMATLVAVLAKGGLDTAILSNVPGASRDGARQLLRFSLVVGGGLAACLAIVLAVIAGVTGRLGSLGPLAWAFAAVIGVLLVIGWLQDAYFLAEGDAWPCLRRNLVASGGRLAIAIPVVLFLREWSVALAWTFGLAIAAWAGAAAARRFPDREGGTVSRRKFMSSAARNLTGGAVEFVPGLLLTPLVLGARGPEAAAYFGIAWTIASLLFLASAAIGRSALAELVRDGTRRRAIVARAAFQQLVVVGPAALLVAIAAPWELGVFGSAYATEASWALVVLAASVAAVAPFYVYLAVLRAQQRTLPLVLVPAAMTVALFVVAPAAAAWFGIAGVAAAWLLVNVPFGAFAAWRLRQEMREVIPDAAAPVGHHPHME